jgi:hypothetical protein
LTYRVILCEHRSIDPLKDVLVVRIFLYLRQPEETDQMNALSILAKDEKFMKIAYNLQKDFKRSP